MNIFRIAIFLFTSMQMFGQDSCNQEFLNRINSLRTQKEIEPLIYDEELYALGKKWGNFILKELKAYSDSSILAIAKVDRDYFHIKANERFNIVLKNKNILSVFIMFRLKYITVPDTPYYHHGIRPKLTYFINKITSLNFSIPSCHNRSTL